jgi:aryl-alcohol dehydrogenase-like predicted oxidoreductase
MEPMDHQPVGSSNVEISRIGLGGYELGPEPDEKPDAERAAKVIGVAIDSGINWLDTSENYLATRNEDVIGAALQEVSEELLVASKVAPGAGVTGRW